MLAFFVGGGDAERCETLLREAFKERQAHGRASGYAGATEKHDAAFALRLYQLRWQARAIVHQLHLFIWRPHIEIIHDFVALRP